MLEIEGTAAKGTDAVQLVLLGAQRRGAAVYWDIQSPGGSGSAVTDEEYVQDCEEKGTGLGGREPAAPVSIISSLIPGNFPRPSLDLPALRDPDHSHPSPRPFSYVLPIYIARWCAVIPRRRMQRHVLVIPPHITHNES